MIADLAPIELDDLEPIDFVPGAPMPRPPRADAARMRCRVADVAALTDALTTGGPRVRLDLVDDDWSGSLCTSTDSFLDVGALVAKGVVECEASTPADARGWIAFVAFLVAAREHGLAVAWELPSGRPDWVGADLLLHLAPPSDADVDSRDWFSRHRYAALYWRRGPGFAQVVDARDGDTARYVIDDPLLLRAFETLTGPVATTSVAADALTELLDAGLAVADGGYATGLAYRLRHRPVPGYGV